MAGARRGPGVQDLPRDIQDVRHLLDFLSGSFGCHPCSADALRPTHLLEQGAEIRDRDDRAEAPPA